jgi:hypothetical protein
MPANRPLRNIRELVHDVLSELNPNLGRLYASEGRALDPSGAIAECVAAAGVLRHSARNAS